MDDLLNNKSAGKSTSVVTGYAVVRSDASMIRIYVDNPGFHGSSGSKDFLASRYAVRL